MNCDDSNLSAYLDHELPAPERRAVEAHLRSCPECAATLKDLERVRTMLLSQAIPMGLHGPVIERISNEEKAASVRNRRFSMAVAAAVLAVAGIAAIAYVWNSPGPGSPNGRIPVVAGDPEDELQPKRLTVAQDATEGAVTPTHVTPVALAETKLPLTLTGTLLSDNPQAVLVNNDSGERHVYRPGDTVLDGVVLREVQQGRVVLDNNGIQETLTKGLSLAVTPPRPVLDGEWQMTMLVDGEQIDRGPIVKMTEANGAIRFTEPEEGISFEGRIEGRTFLVQQIAHPTQAPVSAGMRGEFNDTFTEVVFASPELSRALAASEEREPSDSHTYALKLSKMSSDTHAFDARAIMTARKNEIREMYVPLKVYADHHEGQFPAALGHLVPDYVKTLDLYADREDRIVSYVPGLKLQDHRQLDPIPSCSKGNATQVLLLHEAKLQEFWGGPAPFAAILIEVTYGNPDQVFTLNVQGTVSGSTILSSADDSLEAQWAAMAASDQNNLKQMGVINKMFQNENCDYFIPGYCTVYPEYLTDPNVLTSPWDEPGTVSYELLFPAAHQEELEALGLEIIASEGGSTDPDNPALSAMAESKVPFMFNKTDIPAFGDRPAGRNVLFLDGHVSFVRSDEFARRIGPFLR